MLKLPFKTTGRFAFFNPLSFLIPFLFCGLAKGAPSGDAILGNVIAVRREVVLDMSECEKSLRANAFQNDLFGCAGGKKLSEDDWLLPVSQPNSRLSLDKPCEISAYIATARGLDIDSELGQFVITVQAKNLKEAKSCLADAKIDKKTLSHVIGRISKTP